MTGSRPINPPAPILGGHSKGKACSRCLPSFFRLPRIGAGGLLLLLALPAVAQTSSATHTHSIPSAPPSIDLRGTLSGPLSRPHVEGVHFLYGGELTLDADQADGDLPQKRYLVRGHVRAHEADTTIRANEITFDGPAQRALATGVLLTRGVFSLRAPHLDATPEIVTATGGTLTTVPDGAPADYFIRAQTITLDQKKQRGTLRNASLYLFRARLLTLPRVTFHLGKRGDAARRQAMIPVFGVSVRYGTYITFGSSLGVAPFPIRYHLLLPTRQAVEGTLSSEQTLYTPRPIPSRLLDTGVSGPVTLLDRIRILATAPRGPLPEGDPLLFHDFLPEANPIRLFDEPPRGAVGLAEVLSVHQSAQGNRRDDLYVTRLPELTLTGQLPLTPIPAPPAYGDPRAFRSALRHIVLYANAQETYGNYREQLSDAPYSIRERRVRTQVGLSARPLLVGQNTVLLPRISISTSSYSGSKTAYRYDQLSVAVNHYFSAVSAVGIQYLASTTGGSSPFNFDVLDTSRELDLRVQSGNHRLVAAGRVRYDLSHSGVIDYQLALAPTLHGFSPVFSYNFRTRSVGIGIEVKGITF